MKVVVEEREQRISKKLKMLLTQTSLNVMIKELSLISDGEMNFEN